MKKAIQIQYDSDFETALKCAKNAGFRYVSLGFGSSKLFHNAGWEKHILHIEKLLEKYSLECIQTHLPYYDLLISAEIIDKDADKAMLRCIKGGAMLGAQWTAYHARTAVNDNYSPRKSMELAKTALTPLVNEAIAQNTGIAIENLPVFPDIYEMKFFTSDYEDLCELCDYFKSENVGICWDFGHAHLMKNNQRKAIEYVGSRIKATHIHNNDQNSDGHFLPSTGTIDWKSVISPFKKFGYGGALTLEINYNADFALESFFRHAYECLEIIEKAGEPI